MSLPLPTLYLKTWAEQEKWVRAMYTLGYTYCGDEINNGIDRFKSHQYVNEVFKTVTFPWVTIAILGKIKNITAMNNPNDRGYATQLNSIRHFIEYTKRWEREQNIAPAQVVVYEDEVPMDTQ